MTDKKTLKVKLVRSPIGTKESHRATVRGLGLRAIGSERVLEDTPADVLAGFDFSAPGVWAFARPGAPPLKFNESLDDAGVVDGSLLTLQQPGTLS